MSLRGLVSVFVAVAAAAGVLAAAPASAQPSRFGDVAEGSYYSEAVMELDRSGVFSGTQCDEGFCPDKAIDRKTMAVWVVRVLGGQDPPRVSESRFDDVGSDSFYAPFVERMADLGVTRGCGDGSVFCPDNVVTRAQMAVFLSRAYYLAEGPDPGFSDVAGDAWYAADVARLAASGVTRGCGDGTVFCPNATTTRAQMATFLYRAEQLGEPDPGLCRPKGTGRVTTAGFPLPDWAVPTTGTALWVPETRPWSLTCRYAGRF